MTFRHKLARRMSLLRSAALLGALASLAAGCTDGAFSDLADPTQLSRGTSGLKVTSDNSTLAPNQTTVLRASLSKGGTQQPISDVTWETSGGTLSDTVISGQHQTAFHSSDPGKYQVIGKYRNRQVADTTVIVVPSPTIQVASITLVPDKQSIAAGGQLQFFAYGRTSTGDSVPAAATFAGTGGTMSGALYTAGTTAGTYRVIATQYNGTLADTAGVTITAPVSTVTPPTQPISSPITTASNVTLPQVFLDTHYQAPTGQTVTLPAGGDLQAALNAAQRGDVILLAAGATYSGNFTLPAKSGTGWITIRSNTTLPPEGTRVTPAAAASFARIVTPNTAPAITTAASAGASYYRIMGVEIASTAPYVYNLIYLGDLNSQTTSVADLSSNIILDRVWAHGTATTTVRRCVALNNRASAVIDSWLSDCHEKGSDAQAIAGWNGPGPFKIVNNYLEGSGENILFGGADPTIPGLVPSDIEIRRNHIIKPLAWQSSNAWTVKNLFELKNAQRVLVEGNLLENNWQDGQTGLAVVLKSANQSGGCNWCVTQDVTWRYNKIVNSPGGFNLMAIQAENGGTAVPATRISISQTVLERVALNSQAGDRRVFQMLGALTNVTIEHNTAFPEYDMIQFDGQPAAQPNLIFRNNLMGKATYAILGSGTGDGLASLTTYAPGAVFVSNALVQGVSSLYPTGNYFPATPTDATVIAASDGSTMGADAATLATMTASAQ